MLAQLGRKPLAQTSSNGSAPDIHLLRLALGPPLRQAAATHAGARAHRSSPLHHTTLLRDDRGLTSRCRSGAAGAAENICGSIFCEISLRQYAIVSGRRRLVMNDR